MTYTTTDRVREESGFNDNTDILDDTIEVFQEQVFAEINGFIGSIYNITQLNGSLFTGSQAEQILGRIEELLCAGYLINKEYGNQFLNTDRDGYLKIKEARNLLTQIVKGSIRLFDINGTEFGKKSMSMSGSIELTTPSDNTEMTPIFKMSDKR